MKRIKYRLWSEYEKRYLPLYDYAIKGDGYIIDFLNGVNNTCQDEVVEQYTGLKDKNGKEIYEGDIMAQTLVDDPVSKKYPNYVVCWDEKFLSWTLKDVSGDDGNDTDLRFFIEEWRKCEVIGNIHEPPKDFRPEHLKRMGATINKGGEE